MLSFVYKYRRCYENYKELLESDMSLLANTRNIKDDKLLVRAYRTPALKYVKNYRFVNSFQGTLVGKLVHQYLKRLSLQTGIQIPAETAIGKGFIIGHFGNIVINQNAKIGEDFIITQGCVVGMDMRGKRRGAPTIGNRVCMNANSVIVGNVTIGDDVLIAPNSFINFDVPSHSIVVGNPASIHYRENATLGHIGIRSLTENDIEGK